MQYLSWWIELTEEQMRAGGDPSLGMCKTQMDVRRNSLRLSLSSKLGCTEFRSLRAPPFTHTRPPISFYRPAEINQLRSSVPAVLGSFSTKVAVD